MPAPELRGIIAATVLPLTDSLSIDTAALRRYVEWLLAEGVHGLAVNVDTGEGPHLSHRERLAVLETVAAVAGDRVPVVAGLAPAHTRQAVLDARDFREAGADALLVFPSSVFRGTPLPPRLPVDYYRAVGEGSGVPLVLFQLQEALGGVEYPVEVLRAVAELPQVVAVKEATFDARKFRATVAALREAYVEATILTGNDNFLYESFVLGAEGALVGFGTLATRQQVDMVAAFEAGDLARAAEIGARLQKLADVIFAPPVRNYRARLKTALRLLGVLPGDAVRPPLPPVSDKGKLRILAGLREAGLVGESS